MALQDKNLPGQRRQRPQEHPPSPARKRPRLEDGGVDGMAIENGHCNGYQHDASDSEQGLGEQESWLGTPGQPRINRGEYIRLIEQALHGLGFKDVAKQLEATSGVRHQAREVTQFRDAILQGEWDQAVDLLSRLKLGNSESLQRAKFLVLEQKYLEVHFSMLLLNPCARMYVPSQLGCLLYRLTMMPCTLNTFCKGGLH